MTGVFSIATALVFLAVGQSSEINGACAGVRFDLLKGSTIPELTHLSPVPAVLPLRGAFVLRELPVGAPFTVYALDHIRWSNPPGSVPAYVVVGQGFYALLEPSVGGQHSLNLHVAINANAPIIDLSSDWVPRDAPFPTIDITATETPGTNEHRYEIHLVAEPRWDFLFSTEIGFGSWQSGGVVPISDGDLLSSRGSVFRTNAQLTQNLGIMPVAPDIGLDAVSLTPATVSVLFSGEVDVFSTWLGMLHHGDLLNEHGFVFLRYQDLLTAFSPMPPIPDAGLDAVAIAHQVGEIWFSLEEPIFSEALGIMLQPGDVLSETGYVVRTNQQLLSRFQIVNPDPGGYGLDALDVLPNGVLLFSTEGGFLDARFGMVSDGDLLSENGHVVRRNLQLVEPFQPVEDTDNFGLDGLFVEGAVWLADADHSGTVDLQDYAAFHTCLAGPDCTATADCNWADMNADGCVDLSDFARFLQVFGG